jgi:glutamate/tyrosine decarboxylase-like PLP-dependent enzyme
VFAARERARAKRPWVRRPNLVMPVTAHVALDKAAHWLGVRVRRVPVDADGRADLRAVRRAIDRNTVLVVGSAPSYPWGVVDPIAEMAALARRRGVPMHVDACFGGFILPWLERLGVPFPAWDFRVSGVTSISADAHKYGYAAKGASVLLYRDMDHMKHQFFVATHWPGGVYASPSLQGTRAGGPIAAAWAAMQAMGESGYLTRAQAAWDASERLRAGVRAVPGLRVLGLPHSPVVSYTSDDPHLDVYALADQLEAAGWHVDRQQDPPSIHCSVGAANSPAIDAYLDDLSRAASIVRADPTLATRGQAAMYGVIAAIPMKGLTDRAVRDAMAQMYAPGAGDAAPGADPAVERAARALKRVRDAVRGLWSAS